MREECCHFGTSGWIFTLWDLYFRATNFVTLSDGFHFLFWLGVIAYITSALINWSGFSKPERQSFSRLYVFVVILLWFSSGVLQFRRRGVFWSFQTFPLLLSEGEPDIRGRGMLRLLHSHKAEQNRLQTDTLSYSCVFRSRLKMNAVLFCLCAASTRLITRFLITFLAEPQW